MTVDVGLLWYLYPDTTGTDYAEPYASVSGAFGPLEAKVGVAYAPDQDAIGSEDNLYVFTDVSAAIPETPLTLKAHYGYTDGSLGDRKSVVWGKRGSERVDLGVRRLMNKKKIKKK